MNRFWVPLVLVTVAHAANIEQNAAISFRVYDYAGLSRENLRKMAEEASLVLAKAGIRTHWLICYGGTGCDLNHKVAVGANLCFPSRCSIVVSRHLCWCAALDGSPGAIKLEAVR